MGTQQSLAPVGSQTATTPATPKDSSGVCTFVSHNGIARQQPHRHGVIDHVQVPRSCLELRRYKPSAAVQRHLGLVEESAPPENRAVVPSRKHLYSTSNLTVHIDADSSVAGDVGELSPTHRPRLHRKSLTFDSRPPRVGPQSRPVAPQLRSLTGAAPQHVTYVATSPRSGILGLSTTSGAGLTGLLPLIKSVTSSSGGIGPLGGSYTSRALSRQAPANGSSFVSESTVTGGDLQMHFLVHPSDTTTTTHERVTSTSAVVVSSSQVSQPTRELPSQPKLSSNDVDTAETTEEGGGQDAVASWVRAGGAFSSSDSQDVLISQELASEAVLVPLSAVLTNPPPGERIVDNCSLVMNVAQEDMEERVLEGEEEDVSRHLDVEAPAEVEEGKSEEPSSTSGILGNTIRVMVDNPNSQNSTFSDLSRIDELPVRFNLPTNGEGRPPLGRILSPQLGHSSRSSTPVVANGFLHTQEHSTHSLSSSHKAHGAAAAANVPPSNPKRVTMVTLSPPKSNVGKKEVPQRHPHHHDHSSPSASSHRGRSRRGAPSFESVAASLNLLPLIDKESLYPDGTLNREAYVRSALFNSIVNQAQKHNTEGINTFSPIGQSDQQQHPQLSSATVTGVATLQDGSPAGGGASGEITVGASNTYHMWMSEATKRAELEIPVDAGLIKFGCSPLPAAQPTWPGYTQESPNAAPTSAAELLQVAVGTSILSGSAPVVQQQANPQTQTPPPQREPSELIHSFAASSSFLTSVCELSVSGNAEQSGTLCPQDEKSLTTPLQATPQGRPIELSSGDCQEGFFSPMRIPLPSTEMSFEVGSEEWFMQMVSLGSAMNK